MLADDAVRARGLPGQSVLRGVRGVMILGLGMSLVYSILATATMATCPGGVGPDGGFIDAEGNPTDLVPTCISLTLGPNPLVFVVFALVVTGAVSSALKKSTTESDALRYVRSASDVIVTITVVCLVAAHIWFWNIPLMDWRAGDAPFFTPFPFASMTTTISPMTQ